LILDGCDIMIGSAKYARTYLFVPLTLTYSCWTYQL